MNDMLYGAHMYMFHYDYNAVVPVARVRIKYACPRGILPGKCSHTHTLWGIFLHRQVLFRISMEFLMADMRN